MSDIRLDAARASYVRELARELEELRDSDAIKDAADVKTALATERTRLNRELVAAGKKRGFRFDRPQDGRQDSLL